MSRIFASKDGYTLGSGHVLFRQHGTENFVSLGDVDSFTLSFDVSRAERFEKESGQRKKAASAVTQTSATVSMTPAQMTPTVRAMALLSDPSGTRNQSSASGETVSRTGVKPGDIVPLNHAQVTVSDVTDSGSNTWTEGTNYSVDSAAGYVEILALPSGSNGDIDITYDASEINSGSRFGIASDVDLAGELVVRQTNSRGQRRQLRLHSVRVNPDGDVPYLGDDEFQTVDISGDVEADGTKPAGEEFGVEEDIG